jgi:ATP-binding cassette subfamily F protein 3
MILDGISVKIEKGDRIGVIGPNGAGKSTLLRILTGLMEPTAGGVARQRGVRVAYQAQELATVTDRTLREEMLAVLADDARREQKLRDLEERVAAGETALLNRYEELQRGHRYDAERRIETLLTSLGLPEETWDRPLDGFSGGERNVLGLAKVLLDEPDVMLLDEPSNHLDMDGVEWFIRFLRRSPAAVVMVSHNRHLLDTTVNRIWELRNASITEWTGTYTDFTRLKAEALALQARQYKVQQRLIARIEFQARRLMDMANAYDDPGQAKRAKAMRKRIESMDKVEAPDAGTRRMRSSLKSAGRHGRIALQVNDYSCTRGDRVLFDNASVEIEFGDRVCLVGPNGSGKTTLMSAILEEGGWENPVLRLGKAVKVGEYRQLHEDALRGDLTLQQWIAAETGLSMSPAADLLHRFLFTRDDLERRISTLSGGEKSRLQLAKLAHHDVNLLLLDEPTNHLDIEACEQLEEMLSEYDGTLLVISHDRYFLDRLVNRVVEVRDRKLVEHRYGFARWWREREASNRKGALEDRRERADKADAREQFEQRKARQREADKLKREIGRIEREIERLEQRKEELSQRLEAAYAEGGHAEQLSREFATVRDDLAARYAEWEEAAAALEE